MTPFDIILVVFSSLYLVTMIVLAIGIDSLSTAKSELQPPVSIVVAVRNEEKNISHLLSSLMKQDYPKNKYEIIIVDDASTDGTYLQLVTYENAIDYPKLTIIKSQGRDQVASPKKHALAQGIARAKGDILLLTDADCMPPQKWITQMVSYFTPEVGMVIGFSPLELPRPRSVFSLFQAIESLSLGALSCGSTAWGRPATCSGRNLAYRKSLFVQVGGFKDIMEYPSGDDDLFLKMVIEKTDWQVAYAFNSDAVVPTGYVPKYKPFIQQRLRHASKGLHYGWKMSGLLMISYLYNVLLVVSLFTSFFSFTVWPFFCLFVKMVGEFILLGSFALPLLRTHYLFILPVASIMHIFYVIFFGALGPLIKIKWKP